MLFLLMLAYILSINCVHVFSDAGGPLGDVYSAEVKPGQFPVFKSTNSPFHPRINATLGIIRKSADFFFLLNAILHRLMF